MKQLLTILLIFSALAGFAQGSDTTAVARNRLVPGERSLRILPGDASVPHRLFTITRNQVFPFKLDTTSVYGWGEKFNQERQRSATLFKPNSYTPTIGGVIGATAALSAKPDTGAVYSKEATRSRLPLASVADLAAAGGFILPTNGTSDARAAIQYAIDHPGPANGARLPVGDYMVSGPIDIQGGRELKMDFGARIKVMSNFATAAIAGNDGRYVLRVLGPNVRLQNVVIDCRGMQAAPIMILFADDVTIDGGNLRNWRIGGTGQHGVAVLASKRARLLNLTLENGEHGINNYNSDNTLVSGCVVRYMVSGGMYNVNSSNFQAHHNTISDCGDNGIDSEGGENNVWDHNTVTRCRNGEVNIFEGDDAPLVSNNLVFKANHLTRVGQYTAMNATGTSSTTAACDATYGAVCIMSLDEGCYNSGAESNIINIYFGYGFYHAQLNDKTGRDIFFRRNTLTAYPGASGFYRALNSESLAYEYNTHIARPGTESMQNEMRDAHAGRFSRNDFWFDSPKTSNYCSLFNTSDAVNIAGADYATTGMVIDHNNYYNCGALAIRIDPYQNNALVNTLWANGLGTAYTANGGLDITSNASGGVRFTDQPLKLLLPVGATNLTTIPALSYWKYGMGTGHLHFGRQAALGALATISLLKGDAGLFVNATTTIQLNAYTVASGNATLTLTNSSGDATPTSANLDLTLTSL